MYVYDNIQSRSSSVKCGGQIIILVSISHAAIEVAPSLKARISISESEVTALSIVESESWIERTSMP